jgi:hypothetical protein
MQHTSDDPLALIRHIDIPVADLARREAVGRCLEPVTQAVLLEVSDLHSDPCKHRIGRAASVKASVFSGPSATTRI